MSIAKQLKAKGMTQRELARRVGTTEASIGRYVNGKRKPTGTMLYEIAKVLDCTIEELLDESETKPTQISYMDCWHYVAPLLPTLLQEEDGGLSQRIYVMIFHALNEAEKREKEKAKNDKQGHCEKEY